MGREEEIWEVERDWVAKRLGWILGMGVDADNVERGHKAIRRRRSLKWENTEKVKGRLRSEEAGVKLSTLRKKDWIGLLTHRRNFTNIIIPSYNHLEKWLGFVHIICSFIVYELRTMSHMIWRANINLIYRGYASNGMSIQVLKWFITSCCFTHWTNKICITYGSSFKAPFATKIGVRNESRKRKRKTGK